MNVLLIDPPGWQKHSLSLGLAYLAGSVRAAGFDVQILDMNNHVYPDERIKNIIIDYDPQIIGISVKTATANVSAQIIRKLKNMFPEIIYVAGGPHITLCGNEFLQENQEIDLGIIGEGEGSFVKLIKNIQDGNKDISKINGLCYRKNGDLVLSAYENPDITKLPFPDFESVKDMDFTNFRYPLLTSRGCPHGCIFCCVGLISGKKWRGREPEDVVKELVQAKENYQMSLFEIMDDNFTLDVNRAKKICRLIIKNRLNLNWWCHNGLRADRLDQELLNLMKKAGCTSIALGIESGDEKVFNNINKGEKLSDIVKAVKMTQKAGIRCVGYFIVGLPGDSPESSKKSVRFQRSLGLSDYKYNILVPYPGTKIGQLVKEKGRLLTDIKGVYHFADSLKIPFETEGLSKETLEQCMQLVENQEWAPGEDCLINIKKNFKARFGREVKKVVFIENDLNTGVKHIEVEFKDAMILKIKNEYSPAEINNQYLIQSDAQGSYFSNLFRLRQEEKGCQIIFDLSKKRLLLQRVKNVANEYIREEVLPPPLEWDSSAKRYFAARLKNNSPSVCSVKNGVIYKDKIALSYSHSPQWEKSPCGKIESGLAFISTAAFNPNARYTADYLTAKTESELQELIVSHNKDSTLEMITNEADVLFFPGTLRYSSLMFSRAKMNIVYYSNEQAADVLGYTVLDPASLERNRSFISKARQDLIIGARISSMISQIFSNLSKCSKVIILWVQILVFWIWASMQDLISKIMRS
jgi:anaerobic magnesium-protoporphyrin IX monomethyl ester cyclase